MKYSLSSNSVNRAIVIKKRLSLLQKAFCNDDMFVLCHHGVIHSAQLEGKTAVWLSVNTHGCPIIVYKGRCVLYDNNATMLVLLAMIG